MPGQRARQAGQQVHRAATSAAAVFGAPRCSTTTRRALMAHSSRIRAARTKPNRRHRIKIGPPAAPSSFCRRQVPLQVPPSSATQVAPLAPLEQPRSTASSVKPADQSAAKTIEGQRTERRSSHQCPAVLDGRGPRFSQRLVRSQLQADYVVPVPIGGEVPLCGLSQSMKKASSLGSVVVVDQ